MYYHHYESPLGRMLLVGDDDGLSGLYFEDGRTPAVAAGWRAEPGRFEPVQRALDTYFAGKAPRFDFRLSMKGTAFQRSVWEALRAIPYGTTMTYGQIARSLGNPAAVRAVGAANGRNPISIVVPCHRVIGSDGSLVGYAGGVHRKQELLRLEGAL